MPLIEVVTQNAGPIQILFLHTTTKLVNEWAKPMTFQNRNLPKKELQVKLLKYINGVNPGPANQY